MIEIALNDVVINYGFKKVLDGVSFDIQTGDKAAIVGNNGSGKTTIFRIIAGLESCERGVVTVRKGAVIGYLEQESEIGESGLTVYEYIRDAQKVIFDIENRMREVEQGLSLAQEGKELDRALAEYDRLQNHFSVLGGYETGENFNRICSAFQIDEHRLSQKCGELSGGQKTIVKMAKVLLQQPDILLLDEPTNHIDISTLQWLEEFVKNYRGTVVIVSHDRYFMDKTVTKTILLDSGKTEIYMGNYSYCLQEQERLMLLEFESYKNQQKMIEAMKAAVKRFREWGAQGNNKRLFKKAANMEKRIEQLDIIDKPKLERNRLPFGFKPSDRSGKRVLEVKGLHFSYGDKMIFKNADLELLLGERICLLGDNGSGKSTLIKIVLGQLSCASGKAVLGESVKPGYIEQEVRFENEKDTVLEAVKKDALIQELDARRLLAKYFFTGDDVFKRLENLSGGERVIIKLAMLMQKEINFLILDEPTNHLDIDTKELLEESLARYKGTILFVSHDRYFINKIAGRIISIADFGLINYDGDYEYYLQRTKK